MAKLQGIARVLAASLALGSCDSPAEPIAPAGDGTFSAEVTGAFTVSMAGAATFAPPNGGDHLTILMEPITGNRQQRIALFIRGGIPASGDYAIGHYTNTSVKIYARMSQDIPDGGIVWESVDGIAHISAASERGIIGTLEFASSWGGASRANVAVSFSAAPRE